VVLAAVAVATWSPAGAAEVPAADRFLTRTRQLTFEGRRAGEGYFSPDGKRMVLQSERYPNNPFFQIYILDLTTGDCDLVSPGVGRTTCSYFRAGADEVLFASTHLDPDARAKQQKEYEERAQGDRPHIPWVYDEFFDIFSSDTAGRHLTRLTTADGYDAEGAYSPDGKLVVFASLRDAYPLEKLTPEDRARWDKDASYFAEIYVMNADGSDVRRLTDWPGYDGGPFFSFDGKRIIWRHFAEDGLHADIYTCQVDGSDRRQLTDFGAMSWAPYMHPSGEYAIFASNKLGFANFELFIVDARGTKEPVRVTYTDGFDGLPVFDPQGTHLSWASSRGMTEPHVAQIFLAAWDHDAACTALAAAPPRGTPEPAFTGHGTGASGWPAYGLPTPKPGLEPALTADDLCEHVKFLAADALEGRMTGTPGCDQAGKYIAARFTEIGLEPLGDGGGYGQEFPFPAGIELVPAKNDMQITVGGMGMPAAEPVTAILDTDFRPLSFAANASVTGEVVLAGYGLVVPAETGKAKYDAYDGLDVKDKLVLVLDGVPEKLSQEERIRFSHYASIRYKAKQALQRGAVGFLLVVGPNSVGAGELLPLERTGSDAGIVAVSISGALADRLLQATHLTLDQLQTALDDGQLPEQAHRAATTGVNVKLTTHLARKEGRAHNVVGLLPPLGRGGMANEYVILGAHYDHIGRGEGGGSRAHAGEEGMVHNGADDNASGVAVVLELAAALATARRHAAPDVPQRGIIFACWAGEEIGVIGSSHFVRHAPCPLGQVAAYVNFDMVGRLTDGRLMLQAVGSSPQWRRVIEKINIQEPLAIVLQDDPYLPTDTHEFYPAGIPVLSFFTGVHDDYNRPTDDAETLNYHGMAQIGHWAQKLTTELTRRPERLAYAEVKRTMPKGEGGGRGRTYTGMIPDFSASGAGGLKISGAQGGSPAEKAGLQAGDVIIRFAGQDIRGLEDYAAVLRAVRPGEAIEIVVRRGAAEITLQITPASRK